LAAQVSTIPKHKCETSRPSPFLVNPEAAF
jgi:hypothetical protein